MLHKALRVAQPLFLIAAIFAIAFFLRSQWAELSAFTWRLDLGWLAASGVLLLATWALEVGIWQRIMALVGGRISFLTAVRIWFLSAIVRYIPGNIWQPLSLTVYCMQRGVRPEATLTSIGLYQAIILLAAAPFAAIYVAVGGGLFSASLSGIAPVLVALLLIPIAVFIAKPGWLSALLNAVLVKLGRQPLEARLSAPAMLALIAATVVDWLLWGLTFAAFTASIAQIDAAQPARLAMLLVISYPIAYAAGFLSFFTPSGFGVREGAFFFLLTPTLDGAVVTVAALGMRMWTTLGELLIAAISAPFERTHAANRDRTPAPELAIDPKPGGKLT